MPWDTFAEAADLLGSIAIMDCKLLRVRIFEIIFNN
jgi:hypothetical protein